jgi:hypothetical protein
MNNRHVGGRGSETQSHPIDMIITIIIIKTEYVLTKTQTECNVTQPLSETRVYVSQIALRSCDMCSYQGICNNLIP